MRHTKIEEAKNHIIKLKKTNSEAMELIKGLEGKNNIIDVIALKMLISQNDLIIEMLYGSLTRQGIFIKR